MQINLKTMGLNWLNLLWTTGAKSFLNSTNVKFEIVIEKGFINSNFWKLNLKYIDRIGDIRVQVTNNRK